MRDILILWLIFLTCLACGSHDKPADNKNPQPVVEEEGRRIVFPPDPEMLSFFAWDTVRIENINSPLTSPSTVAVAIIHSGTGKRPAVLFDNPDLESVYSQFLQHLININTYKINLSRVMDLSRHGAASGKEVLEAETQLANEEAALTEHEGKLKIAGLDPEKLKRPQSGQIWLLCEVPETQVRIIKAGTPCRISFAAFPDQCFTGTVDGISSEVDEVTRMNKVRVVLPNDSGQFHVGMFAQVDFQSGLTSAVSIPVSAVVNVQGKDYVFVRTDSLRFERRDVLTGLQSAGRIVVLRGLRPGEQIVVKGTIALKGLSFGY